MLKFIENGWIEKNMDSYGIEDAEIIILGYYAVFIPSDEIIASLKFTYKHITIILLFQLVLQDLRHLTVAHNSL